MLYAYYDALCMNRILQLFIEFSEVLLTISQWLLCQYIFTQVEASSDAISCIIAVNEYTLSLIHI